MKRYLPHIALFGLWFTVANGYQSLLHFGGMDLLDGWMMAYLVVHLIAIAACVKVLWNDRRRGNGLFVRMRKAYTVLPIPAAAKHLFLLIFLLEVVHITEGAIRYPFDDVGMFRWAKRTKPLAQRLTQPKYYYHDTQGEVVPLEIRKQHIFFAADLLGLGYNNEFTFSAAYHYRGEKANHDHLLEQLRRHAGIDTLWVGLQTVDFATGQVTFDPDPVRAIHFNDTARIFYGPIHIPEHQARLVP